jgi:hypothetical protein
VLLATPLNFVIRVGGAETHAMADSGHRLPIYAWEYTPAFAKRQRLLSRDQYKLVEVRTSRGVRPAMLFPKAVIQAEREANAPFREAMAIKRERWWLSGVC